MSKRLIVLDLPDECWISIYTMQHDASEAQNRIVPVDEIIASVVMCVVDEDDADEEARLAS